MGIGVEDIGCGVGICAGVGGEDIVDGEEGYEERGCGGPFGARGFGARGGIVVGEAFDLHDHVVLVALVDCLRVRGRSGSGDLGAGESEVVSFDVGGVERGGEVGYEVWAIGGGGATVAVAQGVRSRGEFVAFEPVEASAGVGGAKDEEAVHAFPAWPTGGGGGV